MTRLPSYLRRRQIITEGVELAVKVGLYTDDFTYEALADRCECSRATICHYFAKRDDLRDAILRAAIGANNVTVIDQAKALHIPLVAKL